MSKTLNDIRSDLEGLRTRIKKSLDKMSKLNDRFFNPSTGAYSVYISGIDALASAKQGQAMPTRDLSQDSRPTARGKQRVRVSGMGEQRGAPPMPPNVPPPTDIQAIGRMEAEVNDAKARCRAVSIAYWKEADTIGILREGVLDLRRRCDAAVAKKIRQRETGEKNKPSKSIMALSDLSDELKNFSDQLALDAQFGPHKPDHKLLK